MDKEFLSFLVHPKNKTPLRYDTTTNVLVDDSGKDEFKIKDNIPVLLSQSLEKELTETTIHGHEGTVFNYKEHYQADAEHYDYFQEIEDPIEKQEIKRLHQNILAAIPANAKWVLDVGAGGGWLAKALIPKHKKVVSMDISESNPKTALKNTPSPDHFGLVADVFDLPIKKDSVDCIVAAEIIEHLSDPKRFIASLYEALKPGGKIIITTPYNEKIHYSLCIHCNRPTPHNAHIHSFTEASILKFMPAGIANYKTSIINSKLLVKLRLQYLLQLLPLALWKPIDTIANTITGKKAYRLMLTITK